MAERFPNKTVFITGGSSGIGAALGAAFAREGARVVLAARSAERLEGVLEAIRADGGEVKGVVCDVTDRANLDAAIAKTVETYGGLDVAVANAGFGVSGPFERLNTGDFRRQFDTNVFGVIDTAYAALPHLIESKGRLAVVSSVFGMLGFPATSAYCASKFAVCGWAESVYYELAELGVSVTCINPGIVASNFRTVDNRGIAHPEKSDPAPSWLVVPTDKAARQMLAAIYNRRAEIVISGHGRFASAFHRHFPRTFRFLVRNATKGRMKNVEKLKRGGE